MPQQQQDPDGHVLIEEYNNSSNTFHNNSVSLSQWSQQQQQQEQVLISSSVNESPIIIAESTPTVTAIPYNDNSNDNNNNYDTSSTFRNSRSAQQAQLDGGPQYKHQVQESNDISSSKTNNQQVQLDIQQPQPPPVALAHAKLVSDEDYTHDNSSSSNNNNNNNMTVDSRTKTMSSDMISQQEEQTTKSVRNYWIVILGLIFVLAAVGTILGLVVFTNNSIDSSTDDNNLPDIELSNAIGGSLEGTSNNFYLGTALAMSQTGHRLAITSSNVVQVFELDERNNVWKQLGDDIVMNNDQNNTSNNNNNNNKRIDLQDEEIITIDMDAMGEYIVAGYGAGGNGTSGYVHVYRYVNSVWIQVGQILTGTFDGDRFGSAVSINSDGDVLAVGAPGALNSTGYVAVYQRESNGSWGQRGDVIQGEVSDYISELGRSVSLSSSGDRVAAGSRSSPGFGGTNNNNNDDVDDNNTFFNVVSVYEYDRFGDLEWTQLGNGIPGVASSKSTGWYVDLDASGDRMAVSNTYLSESDFINTDLRALVVQAYEFNNEQWQNFGERLHGNITGSKSGYVISYSDDGLAMAMGDRGTSEGGRSRGHAHIYKYMNNAWTQQGPDVNGVADGDNFGFSVAISGDGSRFAAGAPYSRAAFSDGGQVQSFHLVS